MMFVILVQTTRSIKLRVALEHCRMREDLDFRISENGVLLDKRAYFRKIEK